jgi:sugar phosphate isomerase/epimerase
MKSRREFLAGASAAWFASSLASSIKAGAVPRRLNIGLELYSFRDKAKQDLAGTLARSRAMGFDHIETGSDFYGHTAPEFRKLVDTAGLKVTSIHFGYDELKKETGVDRALQALDTFGAHWAGVAWIPHGDAFTRANADGAVADFNTWGARFAKAGHKFMYHAHGYEFGADAGGTLFDHIAKSTDPATVKFEMDTFWIVLPGQDCAKLLEKYPNRWRLMHLKDMRKGAPLGNQQAHADDKDSVAVGQGFIPWDSILPIARKQGVEDYFIEDESPEAITQVPQSLKYLNGKRW